MNKKTAKIGDSVKLKRSITIHSGRVARKGEKFRIHELPYNLRGRFYAQFSFRSEKDGVSLEIDESQVQNYF